MVPTQWLIGETLILYSGMKILKFDLGYLDFILHEGVCKAPLR